MTEIFGLIDLNDNDIDQCDNLDVEDIYAFSAGIDINDDVDMTGEDLQDVNDIYPYDDDTGFCGTSSRAWFAVYCQTLYEGDHMYSEKDCILCDGKFKNGEALMSYTINLEDDGTRCIPVHASCGLSPPITRGEVVEKLKALGTYIPDNPIPKREVKIEKIVKDGKEYFLIMKGTKIKTISKEKLDKIKAIETIKSQRIIDSSSKFDNDFVTLSDGKKAIQIGDKFYTQETYDKLKLKEDNKLKYLSDLK